MRVVNGAAGPLVELRLVSPAAARTLGVPIGLRRLAVAVDHPERLLTELGAVAGEELS